MIFLRNNDASKVRLIFKTGMIICFFFLGVIFLFVLFAYSTLGIYKQLQWTNLDPSSSRMFQRTEENESAKSLRPIKMVLFGDSRVAAWRSLPADDTITVINRGVSGDTTSRAVMRLQRDVFKQQADIVVIQLGINDLKAIGIFPDQKDWIIENCRNNLQSIMDDMGIFGAHLILLTVIPPGKVPIHRKLVWSNEIDTQVLLMNNWLRTIQSPNVTVVDCDSIFRENNKVKFEYYCDTLHLNEKGYRRLNQLLEPYIRDILLRISAQESQH